MQPAVFIARLTGPTLVVIGVGVLLNEANYAAMITEAAHSPTLIYLSGLLTLPLGLAILNVYRAWTADWRVIVTILGWLLAIGGVIRIVLPQFTATLATALYSTSAGLTVFAVVVLVLGGYLSFEGYRLQIGE
ncbi:MAG: hypothetical protein ACLQJR_19690 [Stellaceae bacterium]